MIVRSSLPELDGMTVSVEGQPSLIIQKATKYIILMIKYLPNLVKLSIVILTSRSS